MNFLQKILNSWVNFWKFSYCWDNNNYVEARNKWNLIRSNLNMLIRGNKKTQSKMTILSVDLHQNKLKKCGQIHFHFKYSNVFCHRSGWMHSAFCGSSYSSSQWLPSLIKEFKWVSGVTIHHLFDLYKGPSVEWMLLSHLKGFIYSIFFKEKVF